MENEIKRTADELYNYAAQQMVQLNRNPNQVKNDLVEMGLDSESANTLVYKIHNQINDAKVSQAKKDILYGALWCFGGLILTLTKTGFIFWGAILFGGIQLIKGIYNYSTNS